MHVTKSFYEAFDPEEARRLAARFEFHYTPKHGGWLNMAGLDEFAALGKACLNRRLPDMETVQQEASAYERENCSQYPIQWRVTTTDAHKKLGGLYSKNSRC